MDNSSVDSQSLTGFGVTLFFTFLYYFTVQEWAGICTIIAALTTAGLNIHKWINLKNSKKNKNE